MDNLKEFKELIERYNSVTIEEIEGVAESRPFCDVAQKLTGFGEFKTCTLCKAVRMECNHCTWWVKSRQTCSGDKDVISLAFKTYEEIEQARNPKDLLKAFRDRAKLMQEILDSNG